MVAPQINQSHRFKRAKIRELIYSLSLPLAVWNLTHQIPTLLEPPFRLKENTRNCICPNKSNSHSVCKRTEKQGFPFQFM